MPNQFHNHLNVRAHYMTTEEEILRQIRGSMDVLVASIGTRGTLMGVDGRLKEFNPEIEIVAVEPFFGEIIPGLRNMSENNPPSIFDEAKTDEKVNVTLDDAQSMMGRIRREEGLMVGISSGAAMHVALAKARELGREKKIIVIYPDSGGRYLTRIFNPVNERQRTLDG